MNTISKKIDMAWLLLKLTYTVVPIVIGIDKLLAWWIVDWTKYTSPFIVNFMPITLMQFIMLTAVIEIGAGLLVWFAPRLGAYVIVAWMLLVVINLLSMNMFYDIIARDIVIAIGALVLAWLSEARERAVAQA